METGSDHADDIAISVHGLTKIFGTRKVVDGFDMEVKKGAIYGFLGPNGSGKTTTIRMMCGLLTPDAGAGHCLGLDIVKQSREIKKRVGYMTQKFSLYEDLTIAENLDFVARMFDMPNRKQQVLDAVRDLGLEGRAHQLAGTLSGGWKQRLALAACMIHAPDLLLLDEPTAGVDPKARRDFWDEIRRLSAKGVTVLVSTHYMDEAVQCDHIAYIAYGKKLIDGAASEIPSQIGLHTFVVTGPDLTPLEDRLKQDAAAGQVIRFGSELHVSGTDKAALEALAQREIAHGTHAWRAKKAGLEEAFIYLMAGARDNFGTEIGAEIGAEPEGAS
ncbi:MAG: ABC transporter ATP-binding protein [Alphaproteobacteria bacterium]|nr:ABC transporter ATP-binding protein [Alphaproteobacteria bacterium]MBU1574346.1 ABC transporter ATP-binding protein [Alphaproteobacteria bacterium]MBU2077530.1 ABC transporter ATP-binding protein [Alphaproteobacteria bacterium]MBU2161880.1 ABC transporter ATP-binding protein [Alphaproteobacteria bacterium]MBU2243247.1 ABC transporter ATP-binding protein [Alphaproteobacteria bacterium]